MCPNCLVGIHCGQENCCGPSEKVPETDDTTEERVEEEYSQWRRKRKYKRAAIVRDPESTGRKRAATLYPLDRSAPCEWLGKTAMGGGDFPIDGCPLGSNCKQQARHHGPDKNTMNNEPGNVHCIGHLCHNRWHVKNDPDYDWSSPLKGD